MQIARKEWGSRLAGPKAARHVLQGVGRNRSAMLSALRSGAICGLARSSFQQRSVAKADGRWASALSKMDYPSCAHRHLINDRLRRTGSRLADHYPRVFSASIPIAQCLHGSTSRREERTLESCEVRGSGEAPRKAESDYHRIF